MPTKSKVTSPRRKTKLATAPNLIATILFIEPEKRKLVAVEDWKTALRSYVNTLSNDEQTLVKKCMSFICAEPDKREYLHGKCPVFLFPVKTRQSKSAAEA